MKSIWQVGPSALGGGLFTAHQLVCGMGAVKNAAGACERRTQPCAGHDMPTCLLMLPACLPACLPPAGEFANGDEVARLLQAAGARRLTRPPAGHGGSRSGPCTSFLLCEAPDAAASPKLPAAPQDAAAPAAGPPPLAAPPPAVAAAKWYQKAAEGGVPVVTHRWLLDSVSCYTQRPLAPYRL